MFQFFKKKQDSAFYIRCAPVKGMAVSLKEVKDPILARYAGTGSGGKVSAPADGEIAMVFNMHAVSMTAETVWKF